MNVSHVILKVSNLNEAVDYYRENGFSVEYGKNKTLLTHDLLFRKSLYRNSSWNRNASSVKKIFAYWGKRG